MNIDGTIITFYSYKGGVGRSMTLANVAVLLSEWGYRVLMLDWDLEAPGLGSFFKDYIDLINLNQKEGIVDLLTNFHSGNSTVNWRKMRTKIPLKTEFGELHLITTGRKDNNYFNKVRDLDFSSLYLNSSAGEYFEKLKTEWKSEYDFILIDSRTGITDVGGICTVQLPEIVVLLFTATEQSLQGILDVGIQLNRSLKKLPIDKFNILTLPIPSRFEVQTEFKIGQEWLDKYASELMPLFIDWLPDEFQNFKDLREFIENTKIPYIPYFSFGEKLPVIEQGRNDPAGLGYMYENIASLLVHKLSLIEDYYLEREKYIENSNRTKKRLKVFLSYSYANEEIIRECLMNLNLPYVFEILNSKSFEFSREMSWAKVIEQQISECDILLSFISDTYIDSPTCLSELQNATRFSKPILSVNISKNRVKFKALSDLEIFTINSISIYRNFGQVNFKLLNETLSIEGMKILAR